MGSSPKPTAALIRLAFASLAILSTVLIGASCGGEHSPHRDSPYVTLRYPSRQFTDTWLKDPPGRADLITTVAGQGTTAIRLVTTPSTGGPNSNSELTSVHARASRSYAGLSPGGSSVDRQDTWYHIRLRLARGGYAPTTGDWNWLVEWHDDPHTAPTGSGPYSMALGIYTDFPAVKGAVGRNPHLALRLAGGNAAAPSYQSIELPEKALEDHWYDLLFHFVWSATAKDGLVAWFVDGKRIVSEHFPTLYTNADGTHSYNSFGLYNYHWACPWDSTVEFAAVAIGPTRASVVG
jgi:Polysaccharide lyase